MNRMKPVSLKIPYLEQQPQKNQSSNTWRTLHITDKKLKVKVMLLLQPHSALLSNLCQWFYCNDIDIQVLRMSTSTKERNRRAVWGCSSVYEQPDKTSAAPSSSNSPSFSAGLMQPLDKRNNCLLWLEKRETMGKHPKHDFSSHLYACVQVSFLIDSSWLVLHCGEVETSHQ